MRKLAVDGDQIYTKKNFKWHNCVAEKPVYLRIKNRSDFVKKKYIVRLNQFEKINATGKSLKITKTITKTIIIILYYIRNFEKASKKFQYIYLLQNRKQIHLDLDNKIITSFT